MEAHHGVRRLLLEAGLPPHVVKARWNFRSLATCLTISWRAEEAVSAAGCGRCDRRFAPPHGFAACVRRSACTPIIIAAIAILVSVNQAASSPPSYSAVASLAPGPACVRAVASASPRSPAATGVLRSRPTACAPFGLCAPPGLARTVFPLAARRPTRPPACPLPASELGLATPESLVAAAAAAAHVSATAARHLAADSPHLAAQPSRRLLLPPAARDSSLACARATRRSIAPLRSAPLPSRLSRPALPAPRPSPSPHRRALPILRLRGRMQASTCAPLDGFLGSSFRTTIVLRSIVIAPLGPLRAAASFAPASPFAERPRAL